jgi:serine/threonine protein kinase
MSEVTPVMDPEWEIPYAELSFSSKQPFAKGAFSSIYRGEWRGIQVAIKVMNNEMSYVIHPEIHTLTLMHHPNIVMFLGYSLKKDPNTLHIIKIVLVMEWMEKGHLLEYIQKQRRIPLGYHQRMKISKDIIVALNYLHQRFPTSIVHRDLKPTNCLMNESQHCKIADFGISKEVYLLKKSKSRDFSPFTECSLSISSSLSQNISPNVDKSVGRVGTLRYMAPEIMNFEKGDDRRIRSSKTLDIYSFGMVLYLIWEDKEAYSDVADISEFFDHVNGQRLPQFRFTPPRLRRLIWKCWNREAFKRPPACKLMHELFKQNWKEEWRYNLFRRFLNCPCP